ncbi:RNA polymerase sigma factor [Cohnella sp.]|uniref:RNA polymerase sigma factor n=1 Tax=Cohnella sp. TaxID=1883426 RepID=UPI003562FBAB
MERYSKIEEWFCAYGSDVHHFLVYYLGDNNVEDLVQDVFIKALKGFYRYEGRSSPKTWLFAIARRVAMDHERKHKLAGLLTIRLSKEIRISDKTFDELIFMREDLASIYSIMKKLKRSYREVLLLRVMGDFTAAETADILHWSIPKVNVTLHRALKKLRDHYDKIEGGVEHVAERA